MRVHLSDREREEVEEWLDHSPDWAPLEGLPVWVKERDSASDFSFGIHLLQSSSAIEIMDVEETGLDYSDDLIALLKYYTSYGHRLAVQELLKGVGIPEDLVESVAIAISDVQAPPMEEGWPVAPPMTVARKAACIHLIPGGGFLNVSLDGEMGRVRISLPCADENKGYVAELHGIVHATNGRTRDVINQMIGGSDIWIPRVSLPEEPKA